MTPGIRYRLFIFIIEKIFKVRRGEILPKKGIILFWILFPVHKYMERFLLKKAWMRYDYRRDMFTIYGVQYSGELFRAWSKRGLPIGTSFQLINRDKDGMITLRTLDH